MTKDDFKKLESGDPKVKFGFARHLLELAKIKPKQLYPFFDQFVAMTNSDNSIIKWTGIDLVGLTACADDQNLADAQIKRLISFLSAGELITANHAIFALGKIAEAKSKHIPAIIKALLTVERNSFKTLECRNIVTGKAIEALGSFGDNICRNKEALAFIERASHNTRNATAKKALRLLKKIELTR